MGYRRVILVVGLLMASSLACQAIEDIQQVVETVDRSVQLLREIDESGTWQYSVDGIEALNNADGYAGTLTIVRGQTNPTGDEITATDESLRWEISTDADGETRIIDIRNDERREFISVRPPNATTDSERDTYLVNNDGTLECVTDGTNTTFATSLSEAFAEYSAIAVGVQALSIAEEDGTETINGVQTTRYRLESRLDEALDILADFPSEDLRQSVADVPEFYIDGALYIAQEGGELMRFNATYADLDEQRGNNFSFEVRELGNQPDITLDESRIVQPCNAGASTPTP
ncbi:MAG: hypothetical protein ACLFTK_07435 [Anaerolineales bacterium]